MVPEHLRQSVWRHYNRAAVRPTTQNKQALAEAQRAAIEAAERRLREASSG